MESVRGIEKGLNFVWNLWKKIIWIGKWMIMEVSSKLSIDWSCSIPTSRNHCLYAGAAQRRTTRLVCPIPTCVFTTKVQWDCDNFSSSGWHPIKFSFTHKLLRRRKVTQRCCIGPNNMPHPFQLRIVLFWGENHIEGPRWLHGHRIDSFISFELQNEQTARWTFSFFLLKYLLRFSLISETWFKGYIAKQCDV